MSETRDPELERLLRPDEVAAILGVPLRTIYRWRSHQEGTARVSHRTTRAIPG